MFENPVVQAVVSLSALTAFVLPVTMALVKWFGQLGVSGRWQLVSSMATGLVLGGGLAYVSLGMGTDILTIGGSALYGLCVGLSASGVYDSFKGASEKAQLSAMQKMSENTPLTKPE